MKVREVFKNLEWLMDNGDGDLELIGEDSGCFTQSIAIYNNVKEKKEGDSEGGGPLDDEEIGYTYVPVYLD